MKTAESIIEAYQPISKWVLDRLLRTYGRGPQNADIWNVYSDLQILKEYQTDIEKRDEDPPDLDLYNRFRTSSRLADRRLDTEAARNSVDLISKPIETRLRLLDGGTRLAAGAWKDLLNQYINLIGVLAADKGIYTSTRVLPGETGSVRFRRIQKAGPKEAAREKLRVDDPELFDRLEQKDEARRAVEKKVEEQIIADGMAPKKTVVAISKKSRIPVMMGVDTVTGEEVVYDLDGEKMSPNEFREKFKERSRKKRALSRINPAANMKRTNLNKWFSENKVPEEILESYSEESPYMASLTDDPSKDTALTRIYPVVDMDIPREDGSVERGVPVVVGGRFRGVPLRDMVNSAGRQIEGSTYYLDMNSQEVKAIPRSKKVDGEMLYEYTVEPYVTVHKGRLFLKIPSSSNDSNLETKTIFANLNLLAKNNRRRMEKVGKRYKGSGWYFEPSMFEEVRTALFGNLALSGPASKMLREYFAELAKADRAADAKNLERYSQEALGLRLPLRNHVMRALAWLDANGNKGVCALDTGMGKTVTSIAAMQNLLMKGAGPGTNGRFLFVCAADLAGNLPKEVRKFLEPDQADDLNRRIDVISYKDMIRRKRKDPSYADDYIAVFFDEAHEQFSRRDLAPYRAATAIKSKHKILLTASPMVKSPMEVLTMASVANGLDLTAAANKKPEDPNYRNRLLKEWINNYCEVVGERVTGLKQYRLDPEDPRGKRIIPNTEAIKTFRTWVKRNLFFAPKVDTTLGSGEVLPGPAETEAQIQHLRKETVMVTMPEDIVSEYERTMAQARRELKDLLKEYKSNPAAAFERARKWRGERGAPFRRLQQLSDTPEELIPGAGYPKIDRAAAIVGQNAMSSRTLLWTDDARMAKANFEEMQNKFPGKGHVLGLAKDIFYATPSGDLLRYNEKNFPEMVARKDDRGKVLWVRDPEDGKKKLVDPLTGALMEQKEWKTYVLLNVLGLGKKQTEKAVMTATLTGTYSTGQNLQSFTTVIHLDRDAWSNETMKQRTARAWRAGNSRQVDEYTLDMVFPITEMDADQTLDDMRRVMQEIDDRLFDEVVLESQVERLGQEWYDMKRQRSQLYHIEKEMISRALSPYAQRMGAEETEV